MTEIPAPPYKEKVRAEYYLKRFFELGFKDAAIDAEGNVIASRKGSGGGPKLRRGVQILTTPFSHIGGLGRLMMAIVSGRKSALLERLDLAEFDV